MNVIKSLLIMGLFLSLRPVAAEADEYAAIREKLDICAECHGEKGASSNPDFPILAGQHLYYLYVQLKDFKSGFRKNEIMSPFAGKLEKEDMLSLAKYFSEQKWPRIGFSAEKAKAAKGEKATVAGQCVQCHLGGYEGNSRIPRLAGQYPKYLNKTMIDFKNKVRANSPAKSSLMVSYDDADIEAMSDFLGDK
jgi:cytochrome c553